MIQTTHPKRLMRNIGGVFALGYIGLCFFVALFAYVLASDGSKNANQMHLSLHSQPPGFQVQMLHIPSDRPSASQFEKLFFGDPNLGTYYPISNYRLEAEGVYIEHFNFDAPGKKELIPYERFVEVDRPQTIETTYVVTKFFLLGTDLFGRDILSRLLVGTRISLSIGLIAVFISLLVGVLLGSLGGYFGGNVDRLIMWLINVTWSIPTLLLVIAISVALGKGFWQVFIAVGLTMWVEVARIVRGQVISLKNREFVKAAQTLGFSSFRIISKHILPNAFGPLVVITAANFAAAILIESGLSFLGIGAQPPVPTWGTMIKDHYPFLLTGKPFMALAPGLAIMLLVSSFMLLGNALRDIYDPQLR